MKTTDLWRVDSNGEIQYSGLTRAEKLLNKPDTPFDHSFIPYLIMLACACIDGYIFYSLFSMISYDNPFTLCVQIGGFIFGADVVPIYLGIQIRRLRQGLSKDRFVVPIAIIAMLLVFSTNVVLNITTIDERTPDVSTTSSFYSATTEAEEDEGIDSATLACTIYSVAIPFVTSLGSFYICYITYNPLMMRKRRLGHLITEKRDEIRRFEAILAEYEADSAFEANLLADDEAKYAEAQKLQRAIVLGYCDYVRERLKEHLANPVSCNVLSEETCTALLERLNKELRALDELPVSMASDPDKNILKTPASINGAA